MDGGWIQVSGDEAFAIRGLSEHGTLGVESQAASGVVVLRVLSGAVHSEHTGLIFNGSGYEQRAPVVMAGRGPAGDDSAQGGSRGGGLAEEFGKPQVVTNQRSNLKPTPFENDGLGASFMGIRFLGQTEWPLFGVTRSHRPSGSDGDGLIAGHRAVGRHQAGQHAAIMAIRELA